MSSTKHLKVVKINLRRFYYAKINHLPISVLKRQWLGTIPLLFVSSLIVGTSLFGIASSINTANINASQLFQMLIIFGGTTLFFLISNNIRLLIDIFKRITNYRPS